MYLLHGCMYCALYPRTLYLIVQILLRLCLELLLLCCVVSCLLRLVQVRDGGVKLDAVTVLTLTGFDAAFDDVMLLVNRQCVISR